MSTIIKKNNIIIDDDDIIEIKEEEKPKINVNKTPSKVKSPEKPNSSSRPLGTKPISGSNSTKKPISSDNKQTQSKNNQNQKQISAIKSTNKSIDITNKTSKPQKNEMLNKKTSRPISKDKKKTPAKKKDESSDESGSESESDSEYSSSSGSSSSSSDSSSSSSSSERRKKKVKPSSSSNKKKHISSSNHKASSSKSKFKSSGDKKVLKTKSSLVFQILKRWWYALPKWPPENYNPSEALKNNKLRVVQLTDWKKEPNVDENDFYKCFELPGFKYVFLDANGKTHDLRPQENKPSYNSLMKISEPKLYELLVIALKKQIEEIKKTESNQNGNLIKDLQNELRLAENNFNKIKN